MAAAPLSAHDRLEIVDVIARYNLAADQRDVPGTKALYSASGSIDGDFAAGPGDTFDAELEAIFAMEGTLKRHVSVNHIFETQGDGRVQVRSLLLVFEAQEAPAVGATAVITDLFVKDGGKWLVDRHHVAIDPSLKAAMERQS